MCLVKGAAFKKWIDQANSFLWVRCIPGSGKPVLCSAAIQYAFREKRDDSVGVAFFYFRFYDESGQDSSAMLRASISQLPCQLSDGQNELERLYSSSKIHSAFYQCVHIDRWS